MKIKVTDTLARFKCPGCGDVHVLNLVGGKSPSWTYNGDPDKPTFNPSVLATSGHYVRGHTDDGCWCTYYKENPPAPGERIFSCYVCHSWVRDGKITFLRDSTHALAGQTVELPEVNE